MIKKRLLTALIVAIMAAAPFTANAAVIKAQVSTVIKNQDGISYSGEITSKAIGGAITAASHSEWPEGFEKSAGAFVGAVNVGTDVWFIPFNASAVLKTAADGTMTKYDEWPGEFTKGTSAFSGGVFDGTNIWMTPYEAQSIVGINVETGGMSEFNDWPEGVVKSEVAYFCSAYDGANIYLIPKTAGAKIVKADVSDGTMALVDWPADYTSVEGGFRSAVFDGQRIWLIPYAADHVITIDKTTNAMTVYDEWTSTFTKTDKLFSGGVYDGTHVWLIPGNHNDMIRIDGDGQMTHYEGAESANISENNVTGGAFDGRNIWMATSSGTDAYKFDTSNMTFATIADAYSGISLGSTPFAGGTFDGTSVWFAPHDASAIVKLSGDNTPPVASDMTISTTKNVAKSGEVTATDPNEADVITFSTMTQPLHGSLEFATTGTFTYTPATDYIGEDSFTFIANDGQNSSNIATVSITVAEAGEPPEETTGLYVDIRGHWVERAANILTDTDVFLGEQVGTDYYFYPNHQMSRAEFIIFANSSFDLPVDGSSAVEQLEDITADTDEWIRNAASAALDGGLIKGEAIDDKLYFNGGDKLTRLEIFTMIYNVLKLEEGNADSIVFDDKGEIPDWGIPIVASLVENGIIKGYIDNTFRPDSFITRAEAIQALYAASLLDNNNLQARFSRSYMFK